MDEQTLTIAQYVSESIEKIFTELAEKVAAVPVYTEGMTEDEIAGIPSLLFHAEMFLKNEWGKYAGSARDVERK